MTCSMADYYPSSMLVYLYYMFYVKTSRVYDQLLEKYELFSI